MDRETWEEHHRTLDLPLGASKEELKAAYRRLAREHHPDAVRGVEAAKRRGAAAFKAVHAAYEALRDHQGPPPLDGAETASAPTVIRGGREEPASRTGALTAVLALAVLFTASTVFVVWRHDKHARLPKTGTGTADFSAFPGPPPADPTGLQGRLARLEGPFIMDLAAPRGRKVRLYVATDCDAAARAMQAEREAARTALRGAFMGTLEIPKLSLSVKRGVLEGLIVERPDRRTAAMPSFEIHELDLASDGVESVDISPGPDGRSLVIEYKRAVLDPALTVTVRALDYTRPSAARRPAPAPRR